MLTLDTNGRMNMYFEFRQLKTKKRYTDGKMPYYNNFSC